MLWYGLSVVVRNYSHLLITCNNFINQFPSPIMDVWLHHGGKLEKLSLAPLHYPSDTRPAAALLLGIAIINGYYVLVVFINFVYRCMA